MTDSAHVVGVSKGHCGGWGAVYVPYCSCGWMARPELHRSEAAATDEADWHRYEAEPQQENRPMGDFHCKECELYPSLPDPETMSGVCDAGRFTGLPCPFDQGCPDDEPCRQRQWFEKLGLTT